MIQIKKSWETVYFTSKKKEFEATVELNFDRGSLKFAICQTSQEGVFFDKDTIEQAECRASAVQAAVKYVREYIKSVEDGTETRP